MKLTTLTYIILELNAALDTGVYDKLGLSDVQKAIEQKSVIPWLRKNVPTADLSLLDQASIDVYHDHLAEIFGGYSGKERKKWGVERRGICLLIAWTNEIVQRAVSGQSLPGS